MAGLNVGNRGFSVVDPTPLGTELSRASVA